MTTDRRWRKSVRSTDNGACVELSGRLDAVRDSKHPDGPALEVAPNRLGAFLAAVKAGSIG